MSIAFVISLLFSKFCCTDSHRCQFFYLYWKIFSQPSRCGV